MEQCFVPQPYNFIPSRLPMRFYSSSAGRSKGATSPLSFRLCAVTIARTIDSPAHPSHFATLPARLQPPGIRAAAVVTLSSPSTTCTNGACSACAGPLPALEALLFCGGDCSCAQPVHMDAPASTTRTRESSSTGVCAHKHDHKRSCQNQSIRIHIITKDAKADCLCS